MSDRLRAELKQGRPFPRRSAEALLSVLRTAAVLEHQMGGGSGTSPIGGR